MKGWHGESQRHSLAARGIRTRAVLDPRTRKPIDIKPTRIRRYVATVNHLGKTLREGVISKVGWGMLRGGPVYYGGLTTGGELGDAFGNVIITFDPDRLLEVNDLSYVEYTEEFAGEFPDVEEMVLGHTEVDVFTDCKVEHELFSTEPIRFTPDTITEILIRYGEEQPTIFDDRVQDPISHVIVDKDDPDRFNKIRKAIERRIIDEVPLEYHTKIRLEKIG